MTTLKRRTPTSRPKPDHEVRCAVLNGAEVSTSPIMCIVRLAEEARDEGVLIGLCMALQVLTCLNFDEIQRQLTLPTA